MTSCSRCTETSYRPVWFYATLSNVLAAAIVLAYLAMLIPSVLQWGLLGAVAPQAIALLLIVAVDRPRR